MLVGKPKMIQSGEPREPWRIPRHTGTYVLDDLRVSIFEYGAMKRGVASTDVSEDPNDLDACALATVSAHAGCGGQRARGMHERSTPADRGSDRHREWLAVSWACRVPPGNGEFLLPSRRAVTVA